MILQIKSPSPRGKGARSRVCVSERGATADALWLSTWPPARLPEGTGFWNGVAGALLPGAPCGRRPRSRVVIAESRRGAQWARPNASPQVKYWHSDQCNMINGTSGQMWAPFMTPETSLEFYSPEACR